MVGSKADAQSLLMKEAPRSPQLAREVAEPQKMKKNPMIEKIKPMKLKRNSPAPMLGVYKKKM